MSEEKKEYSNEMRGTLWAETERKNDKAPQASGTITISGLELRIAMWPSKVAGGSGPGAGKKYWPLKVEYKQGTKFVLAKVNPANIIVTGSTADAAGVVDAPGEGGEGQQTVDDMPF